MKMATSCSHRNRRRGQALSAEIVIATFVFVLAVAIINHAYSQTLEAGLAATSGQRDVYAYSGLLLDAQDGQPDWDYASHGARPISISSNGSINLTKAANLVALLYDDENSTLSALSAGPYKIGLRITGQDGQPISVACPGCSCGGRCNVTLEYYPPLYSRNILPVEGTYRLFNANGTGAGIGKARLLFYKTYD